MSIPTELICHARPMTDEEIDRGLDRARTASTRTVLIRNWRCQLLSGFMPSSAQLSSRPRRFLDISITTT